MASERRAVYKIKRARRAPGDAETELALQCEGIGLLKPEREYVYAPPRKFRADLAWPSHKILVECQGGVYSHQAHGSISGILKDNERLNIATLAGFRLLRFVPDQVESGEALQLIEQLFLGPKGAAHAET